MRKHALTLVVMALTLFSATELFARGGRGGGGGGRGGGGGGARMGGGGMGGGMSRPSPSMSRAAPRPSPSMGSRPSPSMGSRPSAGNVGSRPSTGSRPSMGNLGGSARPSAGNLGGSARPSAGNLGGSAGNRSAGSRSAFDRPSNSDLGNFLNTPQSGAGGRSTSAGARSTSAGTRSSASQLPSNGGTRSYTTERGTTITVGGGSRSGTTGGGTTIGGAAGGIKVEGAGGNTAYRGSAAVGASKGDKAAIAGGSRSGIQNSSGAGAARGTSYRGATDGTNSAFRAGSATGARDAAGNSIANVRGGYADSSGYRQGGSLTAARNQWGYTGVRGAAGFSAGGVGQVGAIGGIRGPGGNVVTAGRGATFANGQFTGGHCWSAVNGAYTHWGHFGGGYWGHYPGAWFPGKWALVGTAWATLGWSDCGSYCGCSDEGAYYDYGENVTYDDGSVYYGDEAVATAEQYYDQANQLADAGQQAENEDWLPLGVYAIVAEPTQTQTDRVVQLAVNKEGAIRGNFHDFLSDKVTPVVGSVDKESQRVALKLEGNDELIVETGLYNLTNDEVPVLVHFNAERQEARTFIRLQKPEDEK